MLYFVRHGETEDNLAGIIQGWRGGNLTEKGKEQARQVGLKIAEINPSIIFTSDLDRAMQTTSEIIKYLKPNTKVLSDWRLRERSFGIHEGEAASKYDWDDIFNHFATNKDYLTVETNQLMAKRLRSFLSDITQFDNINENIVIVTHSGTLNIINKIVNPNDEYIKYDNAEIISFNLQDLNN